MTRAEQDEILLPTVMAFCTVYSERFRSRPMVVTTLLSFRKSLRLDDPKLRAIAAERAGQPWPWSSEKVPAGR